MRSKARRALREARAGRVLDSRAVQAEETSLFRRAWHAGRVATAPLRRSLRLLRDPRSVQRTARLAPEDKSDKRRRQHVLVDLVNEHWPSQPVRVAEIGAAAGNTSAHLVKYCPQIRELVAVDLSEAGSYIAGLPRVTFVRGYSDEVARRFEDGSFELVFIDADHTEEWVSRDLVAWMPKVKRGGIIAGHDYDSRNWPGVKLAVDRFFASHPHPIRLEANKVWWTRKP
jgi:SAM-dependent methyltransferase